jgi:hypothetical protein
MEVHHHPDLHHKKKNFKEYFLEFLINLSSIALLKLPNLSKLNFSDIPNSAHISKADPKELDAYIKKLKVYNYFLISNLQQEYTFDLKVLTKTLNTLETAYNIRNKKSSTTN